MKRDNRNLERCGPSIGVFRSALLALFVVAACDCGDDPGSGADGAVNAGGDGANPVNDAIAAELCPEGCECSDGIDNDMDGTADGADAECTGPYDNDEGSFSTGIPGDNRDPIWQDCFFDGDSGHGNDGCRYRSGCLTGDLPADNPDCIVSEECLRFCRPRTPNGCDCFGCCDVTLENGDTITIQTSEGCSLETAESCMTCRKSEQCDNACGTCELCPGREAEDLPAECYPDMNPDAGMPPMYECEDGVTCAENTDCAAGEFCSLGCCLGGPI